MLEAVCGTFLMYQLFREKNASRIRQSYWWPFACMAWIFLSIITVQGWFTVFGKVGIILPSDEYAIPIFFGLCFAVCCVLAYINIFRPIRKIRKQMQF